ncbi:MAG: hypothetical protein J6S18_00120 [Oscillospiraceae bacterium]|jgi:hypothetical protein|nr:hypothetical protein [Oscillospiraceae bacterium]
MQNIKENIAKLINVKTIVTFALMAVFSILALKGVITPDNVMIVVTTVIAFYFGTQHEKVNK